MSESQPRTCHTLAALRWPLVALAVVMVGALLLARACRTVERAGAAGPEAARALVEEARGLAERFRTGTITETFIAAIPRLAPDDGLRLELTTLEATEVFTRTDEQRAFWDRVPLGTTISEIRVPVTYRYHVRLDEPWRLEVLEHHCIVHAPPIRPSLPPAIHTDGMEKRSSSSWFRFDRAEQMAELERSLTPRLSLRAGNAERLGLVREHGRRRVAEFVRGWLLVEDHWREDRFRAVVVVFADEAEDAALSEPPTLVLESPRR